MLKICDLAIKAADGDLDKAASYFEPKVDLDLVADLVAMTGKDAEMCAKALQDASGDLEKAFYTLDNTPQNFVQPGVDRDFAKEAQLELA